MFSKSTKRLSLLHADLYSAYIWINVNFVTREIYCLHSLNHGAQT